jgi:glycine cleavage system transcriptional repressor
MKKEMVITALGSDRPGLVEELTGAVRGGGGNLADSRMINLRGHFAVVALVEGTEEALERVRADLRAVAKKLDLSLDISGAPAGPSPEGIGFRLRTYSMDRPGIVHRVSAYLRAENINVEEVDTSLESAPFMGAPVFKMEMRITVPKVVAVKKLRACLEELAGELNCDIDLEPA